MHNLMGSELLMTKEEIDLVVMVDSSLETLIQGAIAVEEANSMPLEKGSRIKVPIYCNAPVETFGATTLRILCTCKKDIVELVKVQTKVTKMQRPI